MSSLTTGPWFGAARVEPAMIRGIKPSPVNMMLLVGRVGKSWGVWILPGRCGNIYGFGNTAFTAGPKLEAVS